MIIQGVLNSGKEWKYNMFYSDIKFPTWKTIFGKIFARMYITLSRVLKYFHSIQNGEIYFKK